MRLFSCSSVFNLLLESFGNTCQHVWRSREKLTSIRISRSSPRLWRCANFPLFVGPLASHLFFEEPRLICSVQRANILKEVQIMRQLDHPNIVKLVDFSESKQYYYIVLELAPGGELFHQIVRLTYFSEDLSRHVITQVAQALEYLHEECGVVHRCVGSKPP